ncbi:hypothetical protein GYMLUDRAFT_75603 [Collybiopsis luxurians FD-317 M1]|uniref:Uncharacterized protein n=1 Tax=Collybiopsis luxurians FD-317 M1 TaxID=944289 RepID=A0A0D0B2M4_9AGAR|nr:hypothetical protein GYMLUDRAFT_75603 [Collybiopsis luxurians FD-317 M1]
MLKGTTDKIDFGEEFDSRRNPRGTALRVNYHAKYVFTSSDTQRNSIVIIKDRSLFTEIETDFEKNAFAKRNVQPRVITRLRAAGHKEEVVNELQADASLAKDYDEGWHYWDIVKDSDKKKIYKQERKATLNGIIGYRLKKNLFHLTEFVIYFGKHEWPGQRRIYWSWHGNSRSTAQKTISTSGFMVWLCC